MTKLPTVRSLAKSLRELHVAWSHPDAGGENVCLVDTGICWVIETADHPDGFGREYVPGDGAPFDAVRAARRLIAAAKELSGLERLLDTPTTGPDVV